MGFNLTGTSEIVGTKDSLPHDVAELAILRSEVIAWTALDPQLAPDVGSFAWTAPVVVQSCFVCSAYVVPFALCVGPFPFFWPFLVTSLPFICASKTTFENSIRSQYWILTETDLKVVTKSHDQCCIPGFCENGHSVQSIPLKDITYCGTKEYENGSANYLCKPLPTLFIDTAIGGALHAAIGYGFANRSWFAREVLNRRDIVKGMVVPDHAFAEAVVAAPVMERGTTAISAGDRIKDITDLRTSGILTKEEYDKKRQEIIDSI